MQDAQLWYFNASEAGVAASEVVEHRSGKEWARIPVPVDADAAAESVRALAKGIAGLPGSFQDVMEDAGANASLLSDDPLQGLAELLQNADDVDATNAVLCLDVASSRLIFGHNGTDLTLPDVWGLTLPWLSQKAGRSNKLGRFGIGLKTLQSLSDSLEVHNRDYHILLGASTIASSVPASTNLPSGEYPTQFIVPIQHRPLVQADIADWLSSWGDAGLLFLSSLHTVTLVEPTGDLVVRLHLDRERPLQVELARGPVTRQKAVGDGQEWLVYTREAPSPATSRRRKAKTQTTPVAIAFPRGPGDRGHLHIGLPIRPVGLPFRVSAQFDPLANRRDISSDSWNLQLVDRVADLWHDACLDLFALDSATAWHAVPLVQELESDAVTDGPIREKLATSLLTQARSELAQTLQIRDSDGRKRGLHDLAYESPTLTGILTPTDLRSLADVGGALGNASRSSGQRWRTVIDEFAALGVPTAIEIGVAEAVVLLGEDDRQIVFLADLTGAVVATQDEDLIDGLAEYECIVLDDLSRLTPDEAYGLRALVPDEVGELWKTLKIGLRIHPEYAARGNWSKIATWLQERDSLHTAVANSDALRVLAEAGRERQELQRQLTDQQILALRDALEEMTDAERRTLGPAIGNAVKVAATYFTESGARLDSHVHPCDAYFIESVKGTFVVAAKQTPGLMWLNRRYSNTLRSSKGRQGGLAAQALFRLLGAQVAPRLEPHPGLGTRYGVPALAGNYEGSPTRRRDQVAAAGATHTLHDWWSPDLDLVLMNVAKERKVAVRRTRVEALLGCLSRHWEDYAPYAQVDAATGHYQWNTHGRVDAWWVSSAASVPWLTNGNGKKSTPGDLLLRTAENEAMHGSDPARYVADLYATPSHRDVLIALGVEGNPTVPALLQRIADIRSAHLNGEPLDPSVPGASPMTVSQAADAAAAFYRALAKEVTQTLPRRIGTLSATAAREIVNRGDGLIITNLGWRRTTAVLAGDPIFGDLRAFVPAVDGASSLWAALGIRGPGVEDAKAVLKQLSRQASLDTGQRQVMRDSMTLVAAVDESKRGQLRRFPVWVGSGWSTSRPVFAVLNPLLADALAGSIPVWQPGGQVGQLEPLIESLGLTRIDSAQAHVVHSVLAEYDPDLTAQFQRSVRNLQTDLSTDAPKVERTILGTWQDLADVQVAVLPGLKVRVREPERSSQHEVVLDAWLDAATRTMYVSSEDDTGRARSGGFAVASKFASDPRGIAHAWAAAWADVEDGYEADVVVSATERAAEDAKRRADSATALQNLVSSGVPSKKPKKSSSRSPASAASPTPAKARTLVDPDALVFIEADSEEPASQPNRGASVGKATKGGGGTLADPDVDKPKKPTAPGRGPTNYGPGEKEDIGVAVLRKVLGKDEETLVDVRHQPNVGADAVDDEGRFFELKVHGGSIQDTVKVEGSQLERALSTDQFYLVVIGNVEDNEQPTEVRIIHDPLHYLKKESQGSVHLSGVLKAQAKIFRHAKQAEPEQDI